MGDPNERSANSRNKPRQINAQHNAMQSFDGAQAKAAANKSPMASKRQGENVTIVRSAPKVGRNDPCPCGSGKKYKQCCGRQVQLDAKRTMLWPIGHKLMRSVQLYNAKKNTM